MSKVTGWSKHKRFISIEIADNCLSKLCEVSNGSFQETIRQHVMYVWKATLSNFSPRLLAVWKLLIKLGKLSPIGEHPGLSFQWCHSKFISAGSSTFDFFHVARLWVYFYLICWSEEMPDWHPWGLQFSVGSCANEGRSSVLAGFLGDFRFPETVT